MKFYTYRQNNSHGKFDGAGYVIVEAPDADTADSYAENKTPIYFDGCDQDIDCSCCGDRWDRAYKYDASDKPTACGIVLEGDKNDIVEKYYQKICDQYGNLEFDIYFADGTKKEYRFTEEDQETAKKLNRDSKKFVYGFSFLPGWSRPTSLSKYWQSDYDRETYYAECGDKSLSVKQGTTSVSKDCLGSSIVSIYTEHEDNLPKIKKKRDKLISVLKKINLAALDILEQEKNNLDKNLYDALKAEYTILKYDEKIGGL